MMNRVRVLLVLVVLMAAVSFWVNFRGHVSLLGGGDEGSYIGSGKLMSQHLSFIFKDQAVEVGKQYAAPGIFVPTGFAVHDAKVSPAEVMSGWNKGFPFFSIPFWWLDGDNGWKFVNPFAGALSLIVLFLIGLKVSGPYVGFHAALLLGTNWLQLWYSRYPMTEVLSQFLSLLMVLCAVSYYRQANRISLLSFAGVASFSLFVHFGNAATWGLLAGLICLNDLPYLKNRPSRLFKTGFLTGALPAACALSYWFLDPGIQRYTKLGQKMVANSTGRLERLVEAFWVRLENLTIFLPLPLCMLLLIAGWLFLKNRAIERRFWWLLGGLAAASFIMIASTGIGTPRVLYVARRNVPIVLPIVVLLGTIALNHLASKFRGPRLGQIFAHGVVVAMVGLQVVAFAPFQNVDQGAGMPDVARRVRAELRANYDGNPQFVLLPATGLAANLQSGMRYVYEVPLANFTTDNLPPAVIERMLGAGVQLYALEILDKEDRQTVVAPLRRYPNIHLSHITTKEIRWAHPNPSGATSPPAITDKSKYLLGLYRVKLVKTP